MGLREMAGDMARTTSGLWRGIAETVDPQPPRPASDPPTSGPTTVATAAEASDGVDAHGERMLVPLDTWTRILEQIGNVHEAGQQLADARERAARAETENTFLREQLKDLKAQRRTVRRPATKPASPAATPRETPTGTEPVQPERRGTRIRRVASDWLRP